MNTRLLFGLLWMTPLLCFGAPSTTTSFFLNVEALTNVTARSAVRGLTGVFTNGLTAGASTFTGDVLQSTRTGIFDSSVQTLYSLPTRVVFDGDSLTSSNGAYATYFQSLYLPTFSASVISNVAVSGQTMWDMLYSRYTNYVQPNKPASGTNALLFAWGGINDIYYNTNSTAVVIETISNYWARAKADGFTLVAFTVSDRGNFPSSTNQYERQGVNAFIRSSDIWDYLVDVDAKYPTASTMWHLSDLVHFTTNSARAIADLAASSVFGPKNSSGLNAQPFGPNYIGTNYFGSGSAALPTIAFSIDPTTGFARASTGTIGFTTGANGRAILSSSNFRVSSTVHINWSSGAAWTVVGDAGIWRESPGVVKITDGASGYGALKISAGSNATASFVGGILKVDTTTTGNVGGGTDNLISYTIPANVLLANGDSIEFDCAGTFAADAHLKTLTAVYGATTLITSTSLVFNNLDWRLHGRIIRTGAATQKATTELTVGGTLLSAVNSTITDYTTPAETLSGTVVFKCTGSDDDVGTPADNAVVQQIMSLKWMPNGN